MLDTKNILNTIKGLSESTDKATLENEVQKLNEIVNLKQKQLKDHVRVLRSELEKVRANEEDHIQKAVSKANNLINDLKNHVQSLRSQLEQEKQKNIKEIDGLIQSEALKRNDLEHTIQELRGSIERQLLKQEEITSNFKLESERMEVYYKNSLSKLRNQIK